MGSKGQPRPRSRIVTPVDLFCQRLTEPSTQTWGLCRDVPKMSALATELVTDITRLLTELVQQVKGASRCGRVSIEIDHRPYRLRRLGGTRAASSREVSCGEVARAFS